MIALKEMENYKLSEKDNITIQLKEADEEELRILTVI